MGYLYAIKMRYVWFFSPEKRKTKNLTMQVNVYFMLRLFKVTA